MAENAIDSSIGTQAGGKLVTEDEPRANVFCVDFVGLPYIIHSIARGSVSESAVLEKIAWVDSDGREALS
jgi:hypothetical protein